MSGPGPYAVYRENLRGRIVRLPGIYSQAHLARELQARAEASGECPCDHAAEELPRPVCLCGTPAAYHVFPVRLVAPCDWRPAPTAQELAT